MADAYRDDLAYIHDQGFGNVARNAAVVLIRELRRGHIAGGLIVDLGCGSGIVSAGMTAAGFGILGIDISPAMIHLAETRVPAGEFRVGSLLSAKLPPCVAVAAVGECLNYLFDARNSHAQLTRLFERIFNALVPGGLFLCDVAGPGRIPGAGLAKTHASGEDWAVLVASREDRRRQLLTREITSFRKVGELWRRDDELHRVRLYTRADVARHLRDAGFRVRTRRHYGKLALAPGVHAFLARKP